MKITHCKLSKELQRRLLEFFAAEVSARTAVDLLNIQPNTVIQNKFSSTIRKYRHKKNRLEHS